MKRLIHASTEIKTHLYCATLRGLVIIIALFNYSLNLAHNDLQRRARILSLARQLKKKEYKNTA